MTSQSLTSLKEKKSKITEDLIKSRETAKSQYNAYCSDQYNNLESESPELCQTLKALASCVLLAKKKEELDKEIRRATVRKSRAKKQVKQIPQKNQKQNPQGDPPEASYKEPKPTPESGAKDH